MKKLLFILALLPVAGWAQRVDWSILPAVGQAYTYRLGSHQDAFGATLVVFPANVSIGGQRPPHLPWDILRTDSALAVPDGTLYRTRRQRSNDLYGNSYFQTDSSKAGFLGDSILYTAAGYFQIKGGMQVRPQAALGDTLLVQNEPFESIVVALVERTGMETVDGVADSVKYARMYRFSPTRTDTLYGGYEVVLSKNHGWLVSPYFDGYGSENPAYLRFRSRTARNLDTLPQVTEARFLDALPGDEVHIRATSQSFQDFGSFHTSSSVVLSIKRRYLSADHGRADSITFTFENRTLYRTPVPQGIHTYIVTDTQRLAFSRGNYGFLAQEPFSTQHVAYTPDTDFFDVNAGGTVCQDSVGYFKRYVGTGVEVVQWTYFYAHIPEVFRCMGGSNGQNAGADFRYPVFSVHDGDTSGRPLVWPDTGVTAARPSVSASFGLWPNPATGKVRLLNVGGPVRAGAILRPAGERIGLTETELRSHTLDLSRLAPGIYLVEITTADGRTGRRRLIIE